MTHTVPSTRKFFDSRILLNASQTLSKSIGLGATRKSPPNADKWVQRHWRESFAEFGPTLNQEKQQSNADCTRDHFVCNFKCNAVTAERVSKTGSFNHPFRCYFSLVILVVSLLIYYFNIYVPFFSSMLPVALIPYNFVVNKIRIHGI